METIIGLVVMCALLYGSHHGQEKELAKRYFKRLQERKRDRQGKGE